MAEALGLIWLFAHALGLPFAVGWWFGRRSARKDQERARELGGVR
jgi:lipopolysaccharide biosynthesis regulator YciM